CRRRPRERAAGGRRGLHASGECSSSGVPPRSGSPLQVFATYTRKPVHRRLRRATNGDAHPWKVARNHDRPRRRDFLGARCCWFESSRPDQFLSSGATPSAVEAVAPTTFLLPLSTITISGKTPGHVHRADARNRWLESAAFSTDLERYSRQRWIELQGEA